MRELSELVKTIIVLRIAACEGEHPDGSSVASKGSKGHSSAPVQLRLRPSTFAVATDTTTGEPFNFFLPKSKSSSSRSSVLSACRSILTKQNVPVVTRDGRALQCMHILWYANQTFSNSYLAKTPSPLFVGNTDFKKIRKLRTTPKTTPLKKQKQRGGQGGNQTGDFLLRSPRTSWIEPWTSPAVP